MALDFLHTMYEGNQLDRILDLRLPVVELLLQLEILVGVLETPWLLQLGTTVHGTIFELVSLRLHR